MSARTDPCGGQWVTTVPTATASRWHSGRLARPFQDGFRWSYCRPRCLRYQRKNPQAELRWLLLPAYSLDATSRGKYCDIAYGPKCTDVTRNLLSIRFKISGSGGA